MDKQNLAYIIGIAIGDGNLSNPSGRCTRLRITCDTNHPGVIKNIKKALKKILPENKIGIIKKPSRSIDISSYSNNWETWLGWNANDGPKHTQNIKIPNWIKEREVFVIKCLKGLIESDGSIYNDRGYKMVNFTTTMPGLAKEVVEMMKLIGFEPNLYQLNYEKGVRQSKYTIRLSKNTENFLKIIKPAKSYGKSSRI